MKYRLERNANRSGLFAQVGRLAVAGNVVDKATGDKAGTFEVHFTDQGNSVKVDSTVDDAEFRGGLLAQCSA